MHKNFVMAKNELTFPSHLIDPRRKKYKWVLSYIQAAYRNAKTSPYIFANYSWKYDEIKSYAMGEQSISKYKTLLNVQEGDDSTWMNIDWRVLPVITKFRRIALNKLNKIQYSVDAIAIDSLAIDETETYFAKQKAKLAARERLAQESPALAQAMKEPEDVNSIDELKIQELYTYKHNATIEMENGIELVFQQNNIEEEQAKVKEDLFDYGVAGYREYIDSNGSVRFRRVNPKNVIVSPCVNRNFSDKQFAGEFTYPTISDLKQAAGKQLPEDVYYEIATSYRGRLGNPKMIPQRTDYGQGYDDFRIEVLDIEFYSVNDAVYEERIDKRGNKIFGRSEYFPAGKEPDNGKKYKRTSFKVVYGGKWIVNTQYMYDWGLVTNMKRKRNNMADTEMSFHFFAPEFHKMKAKGITEQLITIADAIQIAWYKLQNAIAQARPKGVEIMLDAIEDIPLGGGGRNLEPFEVIDMFNETGNLVYRRTNLAGENANWRPIQEIENGLGRDIIVYYDIIQRNIQMIRDITGLNELVDGSTPDPRTLTTVANMAAESSNNALGDIIVGDKRLYEKLAEGVHLRLQDAVKYGNVTGYVRALGANSVSFIKVTSNVAAHNYGIFIRLRLSDEQRLQFKQELKELAVNGIINPDDAVIVGNIENKDQAEQVLAYVVKRTREQKQQEAQAQIQENGKVQQQTSIVTEKAKQQTIQLESQGKIQLEQVKGKNELAAIKLKYMLESHLEGQRGENKIKERGVQNAGQVAVEEKKGENFVKKQA